MSWLALGLKQYPPGECRTLLHFATSGYRLKLGSAVLPFCSLLLRLLLPCRLLLGAGVFDLFFSTCLVRLHKSKTLLPSLLFRFAFFLFFSSLVRWVPPLPSAPAASSGSLVLFPASAPALPCPSPSSPCVGLPHRAYAPVHALNSYLLSHASSWLFLCAPVLPFELTGPLYSSTSHFLWLLQPYFLGHWVPLYRTRCEGGTGLRSASATIRYCRLVA